MTTTFPVTSTSSVTLDSPVSCLWWLFQNFLSSTISGSDLHRFLNSGYLNGDSYLSRGVEPKTPKSPHFHRPPNFSYSRSGPNYVTHRTSASRGGLYLSFYLPSFIHSTTRRHFVSLESDRPANSSNALNFPFCFFLTWRSLNRRNASFE